MIPPLDFLLGVNAFGQDPFLPMPQDDKLDLKSFPKVY
jgi:hypothetical protein